MKKITLVSFLLLMLNANIVADVEQRRAELLSVLDEELKEVARLNKQTGASRPELILRLGQVLLEKGRILKDQETQKFLEIPQNQRDKVNKEEHYKESRKYFEQAQKTVVVLLKRFPKFESRGDAFYILAYNAKELKQEEQSKEYFQRALSETKSGTVISDKSRIALAEIYFNKGSYDKSLDLYEVALKNKRDKWWTKDAFNMGWCYYKLGKYDKAINTLLESYEMSKSNKFVDMSRSIERDIAFFYTEAGRMQEAVDFYKKNGKNVAEVMLKVGKHLKTQGKFAAAEKTLSEALQLVKGEKEETEINLELLNLYEKFGKYDQHLIACRSLEIQFSKGVLNEDQVEVLNFNVQKMSALLLQQIVAKTFDHQPDIRDKKAEAAVEYFSIEAKLNSKKGQSSLFHAGETFFAIGKYDRAIPYYAESSKIAKANNDSVTEQKASTALMASLGKSQSKETQEKFLIPAYQSYLNINPKGDKSAVIYQRLFSAYFEKGLIKEAEEVLTSYQINFPSDNQPQEKMIAKIMDNHKTKNNKEALFSWADKIEKRQVKVSPEYQKTVKDFMLGMQFEKVEQASSAGDKKGALKGYLAIYNSKESSADAQKMAAYNIAVLFYDTGDWNQMFNWAMRASDQMNTAEVQKFEKDFILFTTDLFQRRQFELSAKLSEKNFDKLCNSQSKNLKIFFKNANVIYLSNKQFEKSKSLLDKAQKCQLAKNVVQGGYVDHLNELALANKWSTFDETISVLELDKTIWPLLIYPSYLLTLELDSLGRTDKVAQLESKIYNYYDYSMKNKLDLPLESIDSVASLKNKKIEAQIKSFNDIKLKFPEKEYNKIVKLKFSKLGQIVDDAVSIATMGSGSSLLLAYKSVMEVQKQFRNELIEFTPADKSAEYLNSFRGAMKQVADPLLKQELEFKQLAIKKIESEGIVSDINNWFYQQGNDFRAEYVGSANASIMDKVGSK